MRILWATLGYAVGSVVALLTVIHGFHFWTYMLGCTAPFDSTGAAGSWNAMHADGRGKVQRLRPGRGNGS